MYVSADGRPLTWVDTTLDFLGDWFRNLGSVILGLGTILAFLAAISLVVLGLVFLTAAHLKLGIAVMVIGGIVIINTVYTLEER